MFATILTLLTAFTHTPVHNQMYATQRTSHVFAVDARAISRVRGLPQAEFTDARTMANSSNPPSHTSRAVLVVDAKQERIVYEEHADTVQPLASITKLASALTALRLGMDPQETIIVTQDDVIEQQSAIALGDELFKKDILALALIGSSNSAAHTLARASGVSTEEFVKQMNITAQEMGLTDSFFVEPTGLDPRNIGTARDVYRLLMAAQTNDVLREFLDEPEYNFSNGVTRKKIYSTNIFKLGILPFEGDTILAAKTGHIPEAGFHFAMTARDNNGDIRQVIILGASNHFARFTEAESFLSWAQQDA